MIRSSIVPRVSKRVTVTGPGDADAMGPVDRLVLDGRVPPAVEQEHVAAELQVQPHAAAP